LLLPHHLLEEGLLLLRSEDWRGTGTHGLTREATHHHRIREAHSWEASLRHAAHERGDLLLDSNLSWLRLRNVKVTNLSCNLGNFFFDNGSLGCNRLFLLRLLGRSGHSGWWRGLNNLFYRLLKLLNVGSLAEKFLILFFIILLNVGRADSLFLYRL
jgi:hypothetical protein